MGGGGSRRPEPFGDRASFFYWKATAQLTKHRFGNRLRRGCQAQPDLRVGERWLQFFAAELAIDCVGVVILF